MPKHDPLHKVTIIPRGRALGVTMSLPEKDRLSMSQLELESRLAMMFGGRMAEVIIFGKENITTGASNDIQQATGVARRRAHARRPEQRRGGTGGGRPGRSRWR